MVISYTNDIIIKKLKNKEITLNELTINQKKELLKKLRVEVSNKKFKLLDMKISILNHIQKKYI